MNATGYSRLSVWVHWLTAIAIVALFVTHEGDRGSAAFDFHVGGGAIIGLFLIWRVIRRMVRGGSESPVQAPVLNFIATVVILGLLFDMLVVIVSGYLLPWSMGRALDIYGWQIPSPLGASHDLHEIVEEVHEIAGQALLPLVALHVLGALKHAIIDRDGVFARMLRSVKDGV